MLPVIQLIPQRPLLLQRMWCAVCVGVVVVVTLLVTTDSRPQERHRRYYRRVDFFSILSPVHPTGASYGKIFDRSFGPFLIPFHFIHCDASFHEANNHQG